MESQRQKVSNFNIYNFMRKIYLLFFVSTSILTFAQSVKKDTVDNKYRRSSLYTMMVTDPTRTHEEAIKEYFSTKLLPSKFNSHNLEQRFINRENGKDQIVTNNSYLDANKVANQLVAKWFNRDVKGAFNMSLIKERGFYDASILDINKAKLNTRGLSILADAGEELIGNTFILILDSRYLNKEDVGNVADAGINLLSSKLGFLGSLAAKTAVKTVAKGYVVSTNAYLYRLNWNEEVSTKFYNDLWADSKSVNNVKKSAFENANFFTLEYIGSDKAYSDVQSTSLTNKTETDLIGKATLKSIDNVISKLQENYDIFKTKTPLLTAEPELTAKIGLKEGVTLKTKFEVLEQQLDENGKTKYVQVGKLKVSKKAPIWDNQYGADEDNKDQTTDRTYFEKVSGKDFYPGLLIRQIK